MHRISSTSPHKIQPHQKDTLNHKQKLLAKRAAAKVVRRKINESQQMSKSNINTTSICNQTSSEQPSKILSPSSSHNQHSSTATSGGYIQNQHVKAYVQSAHQHNIISGMGSSQSLIELPGMNSKAQSSQAGSASSNIHGSVVGTTSVIQNSHLNTNGGFSGQHHVASLTYPNRKNTGPPQMQQQQIKHKKVIPNRQEETKITHTNQSNHSSLKPLIQQEIFHENFKHETNKSKPIQALSNQVQPPIIQGTMTRGQENGEKTLNKRHKMRMSSNQSKKEVSHNFTRSLIEEGSEDFTNIEEHLQEDTRISCRNAVTSSLNNANQMIKQVLKQQDLRSRRGTTSSNRSGSKPSNQHSKEETFETSSFFDEGSGKHIAFTNQNGYQGFSPHKCNQMDVYNIPTIFNTLMFGIDQSKVSDNIRESFSNLPSRGRNSSQIQSQQNQKNWQNNSSQLDIQNNQQTKKKSDNNILVQNVQPSPNSNSEKLAQLVTKVENSPILVFDLQHQKQNDTAKYAIKNQEKINTGNNIEKQLQTTSLGRQSHLSQKASQKDIKQIDATIDNLSTEKNQVEVGPSDEDIYNGMNQEEEGDDEIENMDQNPSHQQIQDFQNSELHRNHLIQTLQSLQYIKTLPPVNKSEIRKRQVTFPQPRASHITKTIIFDLDETLVHCVDDIENNPCDQIINVAFPNGEIVQAGINVRPYAKECLRKANENYQVVVFTASHKAYADVVLDSLDPDKTLIQYRLYREHCIRTEEGIYIKDLRIIQNRQLKDLIIVDNAVYSFGYQLDNGIPIIPFYDDKSDEELMHLIFYFNCLVTCADIREQNRKAFQLKDLQEIDIQEYLQNMISNQVNNNQEDDGDDNQ